MQVNHVQAAVQIQNRFPWILSLSLFALVVFWSVGLAVYNFSLDRQIAGTRRAIANTNTQIQLISTDKKIIITKIIRSSALKPSLDINGLIKRFRSAADMSNVRLSGFNVSGDTISTNLTATEWDPQIHPDPAATIIKMMREYAKGQQYFSLEPINAISGDSKQRSTSIQFKVVGKQY